ncbi:Neuroligin-4, X-linked [Halotydeus destructor]|nr:Neuroligin-4, X-linked [Halotydeus destructor]
MVSECSSDRRRHSGQPVPRPEAMFVLLAIVYSSLMAVSSSPSPGSERRQSPRIVTIKYGAVRGSIVTLPNRSLQPVEVFMGIPYASPPVGKLRFMPPVTSSHWTGVKSAMTPGPMCPQRPRESILNLTEVRGNLQRQQQPLEQFKYHSRSNQSEDCLYLNIFAPSTVAKKSSRMAVLVFVHGELNQWNSGSSYDGSVMASLGNVIVVTINYRLGVLGLFRRAIMSSGSVLSPSALATDAVEYSKKLAAALGCPNEANRNSLMLYCLRQKSAQELLNVQLDVPSHLVSFGPTVDGMVIPNDPVLLMGGELPSFYGQYDLLFGVVSAEGFSPLAPYERKGIEPSRRDKLLRTLVRNLFTFHLQVS